MRTEIEIIRVDEVNHIATIIGLEDDKVIIHNWNLDTITPWDLEDLKSCIKFI
mgnify:CR=1 FL=1